MAAFVDVLKRRGVHLRVDRGSRLEFGPRELLTHFDHAIFRANRHAIISYLRENKR